MAATRRSPLLVRAGSAAALVLVAVVVAVAADGDRLAGFVAAVSAALSFDFFLTVPYERFSRSHRADIETAISLFVVGMDVTIVNVALPSIGRDLRASVSGLQWTVDVTVTSRAPPRFRLEALPGRRLCRPS